MNKPAISTILASAALAIASSTRKNIGNKNQGVTITNLYDLRKYANDPQLAPTVTKVEIIGQGLTEIPKEISNLNNLEILYLEQNQINEIPKEIFNLSNLKTIWLEENQITEIPKEIGNLTNLKSILIKYNQITEIPTEIANLTNLEILRLDYNQITEIPTEIGNLTNLERLRLENNPIQSPTKEELLNVWIPAGFSPRVAELLFPYLPSQQSSIRRF
jgi:Leucine-rich repeat (LRR) protein